MDHDIDSLKSTAVIPTLVFSYCYDISNRWLLRVSINTCVRLRMFLKHPVRGATVVKSDKQPAPPATSFDKRTTRESRDVSRARISTVMAITFTCFYWSAGMLRCIISGQHSCAIFKNAHEHQQCNKPFNRQRSKAYFMLTENLWF